MVKGEVGFIGGSEETCAKRGWHPSRITAKTGRKVRILLVKLFLAFWSDVFRTFVYGEHKHYGLQQGLND